VLADNIILVAFAANAVLLPTTLLQIWIKRLPHLLLPCCAEIDCYCLPVWPTAANPPHVAAAIDRWIRQMDGQHSYCPLHRTCHTLREQCQYHLETVRIVDALPLSNRRAWLTRTVFEENGIDERSYSGLYDRCKVMIHLPSTNQLSLSNSQEK